MEPENIKKPWWRDSILIFMRVSIWIAVPVIIALFVGKALDKEFGTKPWLFLATMAVAFGLTIFGIYKTTVKEMKKLEKSESKEKETKNNGN
ncbi:MAG: AtpZ/AtpI family protein [Candidatus Pacebacteria bacterium]|nr:AtpZ/AtpI family protein [Candidatus Paceibacterota bacterium]MBP9851957.1 AtpZ/AtpI family protein [Candidatus Paceibacterota bacterium]